MDDSRPPLTFAFFPEVPDFELTSRDVADGVMLPTDQVADIMGYDGANRSPQLSWRGYPGQTQSFAVTIHDPDAPTGSGFWHWVMFNIPADVTSLPRVRAIRRATPRPRARSRAAPISALPAMAALARPRATSRTAIFLPCTRSRPTSWIFPLMPPPR